MIYCETCASQKNLAPTIMKKFGNCDECGRYTLCNLNTGKKSPAEEIFEDE